MSEVTWKTWVKPGTHVQDTVKCISAWHTYASAVKVHSSCVWGVTLREPADWPDRADYELWRVSGSWGIQFIECDCTPDLGTDLTQSGDWNISSARKTQSDGGWTERLAFIVLAETSALDQDEIHCSSAESFLIVATRTLVVVLTVIKNASVELQRCI